MSNKLKLGAALLILVAGIYGYYQLPVLMGQDVSVLLKFGVLFVAILASLGVAATSESGTSLIEFSKGYRVELKKMVCLLYTSPSPRDLSTSRMPSSA